MDKLIGKTLEEAKSLTTLDIRVIRMDEQMFMVTQDFRTNRVNVQIDNNIITSISIG